MYDPGPIPSPGRRAWIGRVAVLAAVALLLAGAALALNGFRTADQERRLMTLMPNDTVNHPDLVRMAVAQAKPLYAQHCAGCHGASLKGQPGIAPNLTDQTWLYGDGRVFSIERTILYGVRSTQQKSHDITEMPAFGLRGQLSDADIKNLVQYMLQLSRQPHDAQAAIAGKAVFNGPAACFDCHGPAGEGNPDYGAPDLGANVWLYGGDAVSLYNSVYYGRHGVMPAWIGKLTLEQIRALAVYVYVASHP